MPADARSFHRKWGHLARPHVRALAWLLDSPDLLDPAVNAKAPRSEVYLIMTLTTLTCANGFVATSYWNRVREQVVSAVEQ